jgi:multidrug efflux pump subunit AcrA (membrane-fusion protein)
MSAMSSAPTPQSRDSAAVSRLEQLRHRRVEAVAVAQLQRQAFLEAARKYAGWVESLQPLERRLDARRRAIEQGRDLGGIADQVPGVVELIDKMRCDDPIDRVAEVDIELG